MHSFLSSSSTYEQASTQKPNHAIQTSCDLPEYHAAESFLSASAVASQMKACSSQMTIQSHPCYTTKHQAFIQKMDFVINQGMIS